MYPFGYEVKGKEKTKAKRDFECAVRKFREDVRKSQSYLATTIALHGDVTDILDQLYEDSGLPQAYYEYYTVLYYSNLLALSPVNASQRWTMTSHTWDRAPSSKLVSLFVQRQSR